MPKLFTYCLRYDRGLAPNPYWGLCSLVVCKPAIRRTAVVGDWIVGTGPARSPIGDLRGRVIYAMRVSQKLGMQEYNRYTKQHLPGKIPDRSASDWPRWVGDSIYDFDTDPPIQRKGAHKEKNRARDLGGQYALLSDHFFYFGDQAIPLPAGLQPIVKAGPDHRSVANAPYLALFLEWLNGLGLEPNHLYGQPIHPVKHCSSCQ